jgi:hypothetical protein
MDGLKTIAQAAAALLARNTHQPASPVNMGGPRDCVPTGRMHISKKSFGGNEVIVAASPIYRRVWQDRSKYVPHYGKKQALKDARYAQS